MFHIHMIWCLLLVLQLIGSWNADTHRVVADLASRMLSPVANRFVASHLGHGQAPLVEVSMYADEQLWAEDLHFAYTCPYRDCSGPFIVDEDHCPGGRCIVTAISNYTDRASDIDLSSTERSEAIKYLVHLYADIHQPLHVGFQRDLGGVSIHLHNGISLHELWDSVLTERDMKKSMSSWRLWADKLWEQLKSSGEVVIDPIAIAQETARSYTCSHAYMNESGLFIENGERVSEKYKNDRVRIVRAQIMKAATRLAEALNQLASEYFGRVSERKAGRMLTWKTDNPDDLGEDVSTIVSSAPVNRFECLSLEFDIDDMVYEKESPMTTSSSELSVSSVDDLSHLILIKRKRLYFVTSRDLAEGREYTPRVNHSFFILHKHRNDFVNVLVSFDCAVFGMEKPSLETVSKVMIALSSKQGLELHVNPNACTVSASQRMMSGPNQPAEVEDQMTEEELLKLKTEYQVTSPDQLSRKAKQRRNKKLRDKGATTPLNRHESELAKFKSRAKSVVVFRYQELFLVMSLDTLKQPYTEVLLFNKFVAINMAMEQLTTTLIDRTLFDSYLDEDVSVVISKIVKENADSSFQNMYTRPTLQYELTALHHIFHVVPTATQTEKEKVIQMYFRRFIMYPESPQQNYFHLEWVVDPRVMYLALFGK